MLDAALRKNGLFEPEHVRGRSERAGPPRQPRNGLSHALAFAGCWDTQAGIFRQQAVVLRGDRRAATERLFDLRGDRRSDRVQQRAICRHCATRSASSTASSRSRTNSISSGSAPRRETASVARLTQSHEGRERQDGDANFFIPEQRISKEGHCVISCTQEINGRAIRWIRDFCVKEWGPCPPWNCRICRMLTVGNKSARFHADGCCFMSTWGRTPGYRCVVLMWWHEAILYRSFA